MLQHGFPVADHSPGPFPKRAHTLYGEPELGPRMHVCLVCRPALGGAAHAAALAGLSFPSPDVSAAPGGRMLQEYTINFRVNGWRKLNFKKSLSSFLVLME